VRESDREKAMKGIIFTELIEMAEATFSEDLMD